MARTFRLGKHLAKRHKRRDAFWPDADDVVFSGGGWARLPRTAPMIASLLDGPALGGRLSPGRLYLVLWGHEYGDGFIEVVDPVMFALEAGYTARRAERSFTERLRVLADLGFVRTAAVGHREHGAILMLDPHPVLARLRREEPSKIPDSWWSAFTARCATAGIAMPEVEPEAPDA